MNKRRLSFGLLVTLAAAAMMIGCETPPADTPPQPTGAPADTGAPTATAAVEPPAAPTPAPEPPPPPAKPSKEKFVGKFAQEFAGDVMTAAEEAAKKGKKDQKKIDAALEKAKKAFMDNGSMIENTGDTMTWSIKGKAAHTVTYKVDKGDDPANLGLKLGKDGKKDLKGMELSIKFTDDNTFEMMDPFAKKDAKKLVFKRQ